MNRQTDQLTIHGASTALFSTWWFLKEPGILFDCGDGVSSALMQTARRIKHVFLSHADRDHVAGLLQFNQLNARRGLKVYYPRDCGSFPALAEFSARFDPQSQGTQWIPIEDGETIPVRADLAVRAFANRHVNSKPGTKSLSYAVDRISRKLRPEWVGRPPEEIAAERRLNGDESITDRTTHTRLIYSGDTPIETDGRYDNADILIHEATFLTAAEIDPDNPKRNKHSSLDQVMSMVAKANIGRLVLGHFSNRYEHAEIDAAIREQIERHAISIPVHRVLPGKVCRNVLGNSENLNRNPLTD